MDHRRIAPFRAVVYATLVAAGFGADVIVLSLYGGAVAVIELYAGLIFMSDRRHPAGRPRHYVLPTRGEAGLLGAMGVMLAGLAVTFGVMGVINMAHGEMVMLGAYTTFVVQNIIRTSFPGLFDWSLAIALPLAFLVAGAVGLLPLGAGD